MAGFDPRDATSLDFDVPKWEAGLSGDLKGKKAGIPKEYRVENMPTEIEALWRQGIDWLKDAGAEIIEVQLPPPAYAPPASFILPPPAQPPNLPPNARALD